jgi:starch-binding outer membrane protein, SusD/RagB family
MNCKWLNNNKCFCIISMVCILSITGCKKLVHVDEPADSLTTAAVFSTDSMAQAAVTGLYIKIMTSPKLFLNGGMSLFPALSADELQRTSSLNTEDQFYNNTISPNNLLVNANLWKAAYTYIYQCNICMEGLKKSTGVSTSLKKQLLGEVQFVRALCYHYLVNLYGDVPLVLGTNADVNAMLSRSPVEQVYQQIAADLTDASEELTDDKPNTTPTKYSAQALLARVYLYTKQWSKAAEMASAVINSRRFSLVGNLNKVFTAESNETIFQWVPVADRMNSAEGFIFVPASQALKPTYALKKELLDAFEPGDLRRLNWVNSVTIGTTIYNYPYKYKFYTSAAPAQEYNVVLRLAEQYLIRAEAQAQLNRIDSAVVDLNMIRSRAELPVFSTTMSPEECLQKIEQERGVELFAEWGHRWFDLKRTNRANAALSAKGSNWSSDDQLYPIPASELLLAPNLEQNPGYE